MISLSHGSLKTALAVCASLCPLLAYADGSVIDKVYHPYVDAMESELEFRSLFHNLPASSRLPDNLQQLSFGKSFGERIFGEAKLIGSKPQHQGFELSAFEIETKWQLTEQGEYSADWGLLFEYEAGVERDSDEVSIGLFLEKEFGQWSTTANLFAIHEWGDDVEEEFETAFSMQARYRYSRVFEPAIEFYMGQNTVGLGPVINGSASLGIRKSVSWEFGVIAGISEETPDSTFRLLLEYEF